MLLPEILLPVLLLMQFVKLEQVLKPVLREERLSQMLVQFVKLKQLEKPIQEEAAFTSTFTPFIQYSTEVGLGEYFSPRPEVNDNRLPGIPVTVFVPEVVRFTSLLLVHVPGFISMLV
jgi:hypothetical protein